MKKKDRELIYNKYGGRCAYCGDELDATFQVDHAVSKQYWFYFNTKDPLAVNDMSNLMPSCKECNHYKRCKCVESMGMNIGFRAYMLSFHKRLARLPKKTIRPKTERTKLYMNTIARKYNIAIDKPWDGIFYFEK